MHEIMSVTSNCCCHPVCLVRGSDTLSCKDLPRDAALHEHSPERYNSFRNACPVPMYTQRNGVFNLLARVNSGLFNTPDPGPKLYIAHGNAREPKYCTTPLHIDHSDAVNGLMFSCVTDDERSADITGN